MRPHEAASVQKILIVRASALGDVVHVLPSVEALRHLFPGASISWVVEPLGAALLDGHPHLDRLHIPPRQAWKRDLRRPLRWPGLLLQVLRLARDLRRERFDLVLDFQGNLRSAVTLLLAGGRRRVGFHRDDVQETGASLVTGIKASKAAPRTNKVEKNLGLVRALGFEGPCPEGILTVSDADVAWVRSFLERIPGTGPVVTLHPGVSQFGEFKRWPVDHYRALIQLLRRKKDARIVISWGPGEKELAEAVDLNARLPEVIPLKRLCALLKCSDLLVAADTGAVPMAATLGTPTVGLYGPKDSVVYRPFPTVAEAAASPAPCSPCRLRTCEHRICMELITPQMVFDHAQRALDRRTRNREAYDA